MIEIFSLFLTLGSLLIFSNLPLNFYLIKKKLNTNITFSESMLINLIINFNLLLICSFFLINLNYLFSVYLIGIIVISFIYFKDFLKLIIKNIFLNIFFIIIFYSLSIAIIKNAYLDWDGLAHWIFKASVYYDGGEYKDLVGLPFDHYPHLGSYIWAFFWKNSLIQNEYSGRLFFIFIFLISIFSLTSQFNKKFSNFEKLFFIFVIVYLSTNLFLFGGYQEYFLFFIFFCFSHFLIKFFLSKKINNLNYYPEILILLTANTIMWIKQEGFFYYIILNLLFLIHAKRDFLNKFIFTIFALVILFCFFYVKNIYFGSVEFSESIINDETFKNFQFKYLIGKIFIICKYFLITFFKYPIWILILLSILYICIKYNFFNKYKFVVTYLILTFSFVFMIFLNTPEDISWLAPLTLNRVVFALSGFLIFLCVDLLNKVKE